MGMAKKKRRKLTPLMKLLCVLGICLASYLVYSAGTEVMTMLSLRKQLADVQAKLQEVQEENTYLTDKKAKLQDPDYVESYARGNYLLSKEGEQIFYLPEKSDDNQ